MPLIKSTLSLMVAAVSIVFTLAANVNEIDSKRVTGCWKANSITIQVRDLASPGSPNASEIYSPVVGSSSCNAVDIQVFTNNKNFLRMMTGGPQRSAIGDLVSNYFWCLTISEIATPNDPAYADVPFINLGDGNKKYHITEVRCSPY